MAGRRLEELREALDEQLAAAGHAPYTGPHTLPAVLPVCARALQEATEAGRDPGRPAMRAVVRATLAELAARAPGHAVEVRVPPFGAVQCISGPRHTRGTPPSVVETDPPTWLALCTGTLPWERAAAENRVSASGARADLERLLPLY